MTTRRKFLAMLGSAAAIGAGTAAGVRLMDSNEPALAAEPRVKYGNEPCAGCGMIIDDQRFAGAWIDPRGRETHFDDVGCLLSRMAEAALPEGTRFFVHDYAEDRWLRAEDAYYAVAMGFHSPMAYGAAACATEAAAHQIGHHADAAIVSWADLPGRLHNSGHKGA